MHDYVGLGCRFGDCFRAVIVALHDFDVGVCFREGGWDVAEEHGDLVFGVRGDECVKHATADVAGCAGAGVGGLVEGRGGFEEEGEVQEDLRCHDCIDDWTAAAF